MGKCLSLMLFSFPFVQKPWVNWLIPLLFVFQDFVPSHDLRIMRSDMLHRSFISCHACPPKALTISWLLLYQRLKEETKNGARKACENFIPVAATQDNHFRKQPHSPMHCISDLNGFIIWCRTKRYKKIISPFIPKCENRRKCLSFLIVCNTGSILRMNYKLVMMNFFSFLF